MRRLKNEKTLCKNKQSIPKIPNFPALQLSYASPMRTLIAYLNWGTNRQMDKQVDRHDFLILIWKHVGTQKKISLMLKIRS